MSNFLEAPVTTSEASLKEEALTKLQEELEAKGVVGYVPDQAALEIIVLEILAGMAQNAAVVASTVLNAIFTQFGVQLIRLSFNEGAYATGKTKWTITPEAAVRHIPGGTTIEAGGKGFEVEVETEVPANATELTGVVVRAVERGAEYNGVSGVAQQVNPITYVPEVQFEGETTGGKEEETAEEYRSRLTAYLQLQAPRPITATNFAEITLLIPESYTGSGTTPLGLTIGRATAIDGYSPESAGKGLGNTIIEAKTNTSTTLTEVSTFTGVSLEKTVLPQKHPGSELHWAADAAEFKVLKRGTTAVSKKAAAEMTISPAALKSEAKGKIEVIGTYENERTVTVFIAKREGKTAEANEYSTAVRKLVAEFLEEKRELNFIVYVQSASYSEVRVKATVHVLPGYTEATVLANCKEAIESYLSPGTWGNPTGKETGATAWLNSTQGAGLVRYNQLVGVLEGTPGVQYVLAGAAGLAIGLEEAPGSKVADLTLPGPAALPFTKSANIEITAG
jgi:hypothetical protein